MVLNIPQTDVEYARLVTGAGNKLVNFSIKRELLIKEYWVLTNKGNNRLFSGSPLSGADLAKELRL